MDQVRSFFKTKWLFYNVAPYVIYTSPQIFAENVNRREPIIIEVVEFLTGVDINTLALFINNYNVIDASTIAVISGGYRITYSPSVSFYWGVDIQVGVRAANEDSLYMPDYEYYYTIVPRKINTMIETAVLDLARSVDWSELE